jgi:hypothetical protein
MMPNDRPLSFGDHPHTCHPRIGIGLYKVDLIVVENVSNIPAARCTGEQSEEYDNESKEKLLHVGQLVFQILSRVSIHAFPS